MSKKYKAGIFKDEEGKWYVRLHSESVKCYVGGLINSIIYLLRYKFKKTGIICKIIGHSYVHKGACLVECVICEHIYD